jgi:hypothetical protein
VVERRAWGRKKLNWEMSTSKQKVSLTSSAEAYGSKEMAEMLNSSPVITTRSARTPRTTMAMVRQPSALVVWWDLRRRDFGECGMWKLMEMGAFLG